VVGKPLDGKVALVTGAGSPIGMGRAMALALVAAGARVSLVDIDAAALEDAVTETEKMGAAGAALPLVADISKPETAERVIERTRDELGGIHILVNNAGAQLRRPPKSPAEPVRFSANFWDTDPEQWARLMAINLHGQFFMARAAVGPMLAQQWGRIIGVTTSLTAMVGKGTVPYGPSKAGHEALMAVMARDLEGTGVTANVLVPGGAVDTNLVPPEIDRTGWIQPQIMQAPVVWLASEASKGVNGRRFIARNWDDSLPEAERIARASAPTGWPLP
jgi:NAD(P)-dependent dehydrogenase (short-subunit alcohol dehydrogenase family)